MKVGLATAAAIAQLLMCSSLWAQERRQGPVALSIDCDGREGGVSVEGAEVRRVLMAELGIQVVQGEGSEQRLSWRISVQCLSGYVRVAVVVDPSADRAYVRFIDLEQEAAVVRMRVLSLAIVEAMEAAGDAEPQDGNILVPPDSTEEVSSSTTPPLVPVIRRILSRRPETTSTCVPREVVDAVLQCPIGAEPVAGDERPRVIASRRPTADETLVPTKTRPGLPERFGRAEESRGTRAGRTLAEQLEVVEMARRLVDNTLQNSLDWSPRVLRLAGFYEDLAVAYRARARDLDEVIYSVGGAGENPTATKLRKTQSTFERGEVRARDGAIEQYARWAERFPDATERDGVLASLGALSEAQAEYYARRANKTKSPELRDRESSYLKGAERVYATLVKLHPGSPYVNSAYLFFADTAYERGEPEEALGHYRRLVQSKHPAFAPLAMYRSAWCHVMLDRDREALSSFVSSIRFAQSHQSSKTAAAVARQARGELLGPFSRVFSPQKAWQFFKRVGGDLTVEMMEGLAQRYFKQGQWHEADSAYSTLMSHVTEGKRRCFYQAQIARVGLRRLSRRDQAAKLHSALDVMNAFVSESHPASEERECREEVASLVIDVATSWHNEALGPRDGEGTGDRETMALASELYQRALEEFPHLDDLELEDWSPASRPNTYRLSYWYADLLYARGLWAECGPAFDGVAEMDVRPGAELLAEAAYGALLCYDRLHERQRNARQGQESADEGALPSLDSLRPRDFSPTEQKMMNAYTRYLCFVSESEDLTRIGYRRARVHLEANHFEEAAILFRDVALSAPGDELGQEAALRYVDALNAIGRRDPERFRPCRGDMEVAIERFLQDSRIVDNERVETELTRTRCSILWSRAEEHAQSQQFEPCSELYLEIYDHYREPCQQISGHGLDEVLHNAAFCLEADSRVGRALEVRQILIDEFGEGSHYAHGRGGKGSPLAARAIYHMGRSYQDIAYFTKAAERYETFASRYPGEDQARVALQNATLFRMKLGQPEKALDDSRLFEKNYGKVHKAETATVLLSVGTIFLDRQQWTKAAEHYRLFLKRYGRDSSPDAVIKGHVNAGFALWKQNGRKRREANSHFARALKIANSGRRQGDETLDERLFRYRALLGPSSSQGDEPEPRVLRLINAVAKARFYRAEEQYEQFSAISMPTFRPKKTLPNGVRRWWIETQGRETVRTVERAFKSMNSEDRLEWFHIIQTEHWAATELAPWLEHRRAVQVGVMELYRQVAGEDVPEWEIAAAKRVGDMYRSTLKALVEAPIPEDFEARRGELVQQYREFAVSAYVQCLRESTRNQWFNDWSRNCERELNKLMPRDYPIADEIMSAPVYAPSPLATPDIAR